MPGPELARRTRRICVCIPTFRRPVLLARLIEQVIAELDGRDGTIVVADNEVSEAVAALVLSYRDRFPSIHYLPVAARGISHARNALIDGAFAHAPNFDWIVMYDDDAVLRPGALGYLVDGGDGLQADIAGGPATGLFPDGCDSIFARNSVLAYRSRWRTGPVALLEMTQNIAIAQSFFDKIQRPLFNPVFGLTGGEDVDLFRRARIAGARLVWVDEAGIDEIVPGDRATTGSVMYRAFTTGASLLAVDRQFDGALKLGLFSVYGTASCAGSAALRLMLGKRDRAARDALGMVYFAGRLASLMGWKAARYA